MFSVKCKFFSCLQKAGGVRTAYFNFCPLWVWLGCLVQFQLVFCIHYLLIVVYGSFVFGTLPYFISVDVWFNGALQFSLKNYFSGKSFQTQFLLFNTIGFFMKKENIILNRIGFLIFFENLILLKKFLLIIFLKDDKKELLTKTSWSI